MQSRIEKVRTDYGDYYTFENDLISKYLKRYGSHQRNEIAMLFSLIEKGDLIIDVGAHIGTFSIPFATQLSETGHIYAFEACYDNFELLNKNIELNNFESVISAIFALVTCYPGKYVPMKDQLNNSGSTYFSPVENDKSRQLPCMNLDNWIGDNIANRSINLIKIDTEGMEYNVLKSCEQIIDRYRPVLYMEITHYQLQRNGCTVKDIQNLLRKFGYHFFVNSAPRTSNTEDYEISRLINLFQLSNSFDLLAIHPSSNRYPKSYKNSYRMAIWIPKHSTKQILKRVLGYKTTGTFKRDIIDIFKSIYHLIH